MKFIKNEENGYIRSGIDISNKKYDAFDIDDTIHIVYNIDTENQSSSSRTKSEIKENLDDYLWLPFIEFI